MKWRAKCPECGREYLGTCKGCVIAGTLLCFDCGDDMITPKIFEDVEWVKS